MLTEVQEMGTEMVRESERGSMDALRIEKKALDKSGISSIHGRSPTEEKDHRENRS